MKFYMFADDILVGWSELLSGDPPMGVAFGSFHPNEAYKQIQPLILECQHHDGINGVNDEQLFRLAHKKFNNIHFRIQTEDGYELHPTGIAFTDYSEGPGQDPYEVSLLGIPHEEYLRYFYNLYKQYYHDQ